MRLLLLLAGIGLVLAAPRGAAAQSGSCQLIENEYSERRIEGGFAVIFIQGPLLVRCEGGAEIRSAVGTLYEASREIHLSGNVSFHDPERRLTSLQATYSSVTGRLYATGNVVFTDLAEGMTLRGPELEYYRAMAGRPEAQAIATQRPHLTLQPRGRAGAPPPEDAEPIEIDADRMTMVGNDHFTAIGQVEVRRSDFEAFSNEARVDQVNERMELRGNARIEAEQFDLTGERIDIATPGDQLERIVAQRDAVLAGEDLRIDAAELHLFFADDQLQRMVARHLQEGEAPRPVATARGFRLEADSLDAHVPNQQLEHVIAIGGARGESLDTTAIPSGRIARAAPSGNLMDGDRDWILGDTVTGYFAPVDTAAAQPSSAPDEATERREEVQLERVVAQGSAQSLYRVRNEREPETERPGLNYLVGEMIELSFREGELSVADVRGLQRGLFLDPVEEEPVVDEEQPPLPEQAAATAPARARRR